MRRLAGAVAAAAAVLVTGASLAACGSPANGPNTITLYSGQHLQTADQLISAFEKKTGINVVVRSDDEDVLADQIATEGSKSPADVFVTENSPPLESLQAKGLLATVDAGTLSGDAQPLQLAAG